MGTSTSVPGSPKWEGVKGASSRAAGKDSLDTEKASEILADFVDKLRDGKDDGIGTLPSKYADNIEQVRDRLKELLKDYPRISTPVQSPFRPSTPTPSRKGSSSGGGGSGGGAGGSRSGRGSGIGRSTGGGGSRSVRAITSRGLSPTAARVATFLSNVVAHGLEEALKDAGIDVGDCSPDEIALSLADVLCGPNSLLVDVELRAATSALLEDLCASPTTITDLESAFENAASSLGEIVGRLFENYIVERFKTTLSEHLSKYSYNAADQIAREARILVSTEMKIVEAERVDLTKVDWAGKEGAGILDAILEKTIAVYLS